MAPCRLLQVGWGLRRPCGFRLAAALCAAAVVALALASASDATSSSFLGINYGRVGNNLPQPQFVLPLLEGLGIGRVRMYDADPNVLRAFARTGVELVVGVPDECLAAVADPGGAAQWLKQSVVPFLPDTKIAVLTVGNEVLTGANSSALSRTLLPAMWSLHGAVASLGLDKQITVTTAHNLGVLGTSYPPSAGAFRKDLLPFLCPILDYHARTGSPFLVNAYPYFAYSGDPRGVQLDYALLEPAYPGVPDPNSGLHYPNLLVAQVDAVYHAVAAANTAASRVVEVRVSETGWPSAGAVNETGATPQNAARYNSNAMRLVAEGKGTPLKPGVPLRAYVFALFNENLKPGLASERYYGLFKPDGTPAYELSFKLPRENSTFGHGGGGGGFGGNGNANGSSGYSGGNNGYYDISAAPRDPPVSSDSTVLSQLFLLLAIMI
ncbi:Glucan endo-1,3-beta-glucosidase 11 [Dichanthelium oligosanthes]|uniref:glucan endo-1,3-beta-D-glucosidase n=1 Tax=Dichanthelium oligosanthes TaxID=888268 RepID=A0A1E5VR60_9POAL|nr:Glucan endo-1,3-beta-glucosidase 11 [Dichanthelium oligosanthes]